jgi:hypothetical protein
MLHGGASCETSVRPVISSVCRIGSRLTMSVGGRLTSFHAAVAGKAASSKVTWSVSVNAWNSTLPVFQLTPSVGSPASRAMPPAPRS